MSAGELALVVGAVLCALAFAALAVTLVRVRDTVGELRTELRDLRQTNLDTRAAVVDALDEARRDLDRFDHLLGSAEAISGAVGRTNRVARVAMSTPAIKAAGVATGTSRAIKRLRGPA
ncbi:hypothetical protein [Desertimonas flava]|uniref:hypothetical protein n=1 Tax=Desertimonas flava TaxID=2064846 RepID=UPI000E343951|nr:hypothetical protein [Desertimonas flava]